MRSVGEGQRKQIILIKCRIQKIQYFLLYMNISILYHGVSQCHSTQWMCHKYDSYSHWHGLVESEEAEIYIVLFSHNQPQHRAPYKYLFLRLPLYGKIRTHYSSSYMVCLLFVLSSIMLCSVWKMLSCLISKNDCLAQKGIQLVENRRMSFYKYLFFLNSIASVRFCLNENSMCLS